MPVVIAAGTTLQVETAPSSGIYTDLTSYIVRSRLTLKVQSFDFTLVNPPANSTQLGAGVKLSNPTWTGKVVSTASSDPVDLRNGIEFVAVTASNSQPLVASTAPFDLSDLPTAVPPDDYLLEDGSGSYLLEDGTDFAPGTYMLEGALSYGYEGLSVRKFLNTLTKTTLSIDQDTESIASTGLPVVESLALLASFKAASPIAVVALVGSLGAFATGTASSVSPAFGQATTSGNLLIAWVSANAAGIGTAAAGWVEAGVLSSTSQVSIWYKKNCGTGETAPVFTATAGGATPMYAQLAEFTGADTAAPFEQSGTFSFGSSGILSVRAPQADASPNNLVVTAVRWAITSAATAAFTSIYNNLTTAVTAGQSGAASTAGHAVHCYGINSPTSVAQSGQATVLQPGLRPGNIFALTSLNQGYNAIPFQVNQVTITWPGPSNPRYAIEFGDTPQTLAAWAAAAAPAAPPLVPPTIVPSAVLIKGNVASNTGLTGIGAGISTIATATFTVSPDPGHSLTCQIQGAIDCVTQQWDNYVAAPRRAVRATLSGGIFTGTWQETPFGFVRATYDLSSASGIALAAGTYTVTIDTDTAGQNQLFVYSGWVQVAVKQT